MKILESRALRGPNYWSSRRHNLIVMRVDLEEMEKYPSNTISGFPENMEKLMPSLYEHRCSRGYEGGFLERLREGTWMGHVMEHVALELQILAGMQCGFGRCTWDGEEGIYSVVFSYEEERAGFYAAEAAFEIVRAMINGESYDLQKDIQALREIREQERFGPSTASIVHEAKKRHIPVLRLNSYSLVQLGWGIHQQRIQATVTGRTSSIGLEIAFDKEETKNMLHNNGCPVPYGLVVCSAGEVEAAVCRVGFPVVVKPVDGHHGQGATINVQNPENALAAFEAAREYSSRVIVEKCIKGSDFRLLVINYKLAAAAKRVPAHVTGNGRSSIEELIREVNQDPRRGYGHEKMLTEITVDDMTKRLLELEGLSLDSVLSPGRTLYLKTTANLSTGGVSEDVTDTVHSYNVFLAERVARIIDLDVCGIDVIAPSLAEPLSETGGAIIEVNGAPGFRMHLSPVAGQPRNVAEPVLDMLFPLDHPGRIPIISVTGTNGKTTTTRLIAHIMHMSGKKVGYTTTDGIYIQNRLLYKGDCSGPDSARFVLRDPTVDYAVFETARGGMMRAGLGYDLSDVGVVTNVASDHLGLYGIHTLEQLTRLKCLVADNVQASGYAVLNADDDYVYSMQENVSCNTAFFSMNAGNPRIKKHCASGGTAAVYDEGDIILRKGDWSMLVDRVINIPLTYFGKAAFQVQNVLAACLAAFVQEVKVEEIRLGLQTFAPSSAQLPGRMNIFEFEKFKVLIDYAHNPSSMEAMGRFVSSLGMGVSTAILAGTGDRRDKDLQDYGRVAAEYFDRIIVWEDQDYARGRDSMKVMQLIQEGAASSSKKARVLSILDEDDAVDHALQEALPEAIICIFTGRIEAMTAKIKALREKELDLIIAREDIPNISPELRM
ncbi:cyanophycin synthetase [Desulfonatronospira sp. MSAO_Bac3]|uniref:cyanophycin synthetase n=1 Tax=Desulfonatronospira sp. MSAO_Bac3 TaxID=2293857 RepID=UPI000FF3C9A6|nr:cyanophycin synthetase [Desulfonatronospira sp. MSAO_Bac3]RQD74306.1 MAG: cyanophycin synthetase [Desulfonatronospira sp. MSAO_Bac3]